jgi:hypothetical protein
MTDDNLYGVDVDYSPSAANYAATSGRVGSAAAASQAGRVVLGYDPSQLLAPLRLDANGSLRVMPASPAGTSAYVYNGQPAPAPTSQYGQQLMALQPLPTPLYMPLTLDPLGALNVHEKSKPTARYIVPTTSGGASGTSIFSLVNGSAGSVIRIQQVNIQTPYTYTTGGTVLGLSSPTNQSVVMLHEMRRISGHTKGTAGTIVSYGMADTADTMDAAIIAYSNATVSGAAAAAFHRADANSPSGLPWYVRGDPNQKTFLLRAGEGVSINTVTNTSNYKFDLEVIVTASPA